MAEDPSLIACHECGLLMHTPVIPAGRAAVCRRCGSALFDHKSAGFELPLNLYIAAVILFVIANSFPFITFRMEGLEETSILISGVVAFYHQGFWQLAGLVLMVAILIPAVKIVSSLYVIAPLTFGRRLPGGVPMFRIIEKIHPWAMMEVYLLGVAVAYVKLRDLATLELGPGVFAFAALILVLTWADSAVEPRAVWERLVPRVPRPVERNPEAEPDLRGANSHFVGCHTCGLASSAGASQAHAGALCTRCGSRLHRRKTNSVARTTALVITAAILYIPANIFPVMTVITFGSGESDTIISGVKVLIEVGMWPVALLVFFASITVPVLKLIGLSYLLISVRRRSTRRLKDRTLMYRIIEQVGRWSMVDIFMIAILIALVQLGSIATIEPGVGAIAFACVVVITMIASMSFDPRLMWDAAGENDD